MRPEPGRGPRVTARALPAALVLSAALTLVTAPGARAADRTSASAGHVFHVDCAAPAGGDGSRDRPWSTLAQANAQPYGPGDRLLFRRGSTCTGTLAPRGEGSATAPFTIADYGSAAARARLDGAGAHDTVLLSNTQYLRLSALEIVNAARPGSERNGVRLRLTDYGTARGIAVTGLYVHDVRGGDAKTLTGSSGIHVAVEGTARPSRYDGLEIAGNRIEDVDREGVYFKSTWSRRPLVGNQQDPHTYPGAWTPSTRVRVRHNTLRSLAGDGIKLDTTAGAVVEHNRVDGFQLRSPSANAGVWTFNTDDTLVQFNEVSGGGNTHDGMSFDADGASRNTVFQYNNSHDNKGGFLLLCPYSGAKTVGTTVRYNVSRNDGARLIQNCAGPVLDTRIYNNSFLNTDRIPAYLVQDDTPSPTTTDHELTVRNNIFVSRGQGGYALKNPTPGLRFDHNVFHGLPPAHLPANPGGTTADPGLRDDFRLTAGSPAHAAGQHVADNGGRDYFGTPLPAGAPTIGAYEGPGVH
ncbi:right-handed parallel beta-helix repeat-containing protein [Streptomyces chrestomyceticus]|uniref:right-handed parallel beta-helix repeat-containing protein n=1 Tax=Streptomyces chrestomyceticus TaxID=68185 RepID=UPI0019D0B928|nr:right-handed parallel beta-helix repeat-containing protein [Streptomyces chrestomyceticus]